MPEPTPEPANAAAPNLGQLLENTLHHAKDLLQAELSLARREVSGEVSSALGAVALLLAGAMFFQAALTTLGVFLVLAFGVSALSVAPIVALSGTGLVLCLLAKRALARRKLPRTTARLALDARQVMETVK